MFHWTESTFLYTLGTPDTIVETTEHVTLGKDNINILTPKDADIFIGYATTYGKTTLISRTNGTVFFKALTQCLKDNFTHMPLDDIYTMVTDIVAGKKQRVKPKTTRQTRQQANNKSKEESALFMNIPQKQSTLRMPLYFTANPVKRVNYILKFVKEAT